MNKLVLTTALILSAAAPAFADTAADVHAQIWAEDESNNNGVAYPLGEGVAFSTKGASVATDVHAALFAEDEDNNNGLSYVVSSKGGSSAAADVLRAIAAEDEDNNNFFK